MQQEQTNYLSMVSGVLQGMEETKETWEDEEEIVAAVDDVKSEYAITDSKVKATEGIDITGYSDAKREALENIVNKTLRVAKKASAYAKKTGDLVLLPIVNHSLSSLGRGMQKEVIARCSAVVAHVTLKLALMVTFKLTSAELTALSALIADFNKKYDEKTTAQSGRSTKLDEIAGHISILHDKLDILDDVIEGFMDESFIANYKNLRVIKDFGQNKTAPNKVTPTVKGKSEDKA